MIVDRYNQIQRKEKLIEEKRLEIRKFKNDRSKICDLMDLIGNVYEYFAIPLCAISISLVALFAGPIVYVLPIAMSIGAISVISYKFVLKNKLEKFNKKISLLKKERQELYDQRENLYEQAFDDLQHQHLDEKDYYHQILNASKECDILTKKMVPYKQKKAKCENVKNIISKIFDYGLAPASTIVLPLVCALSSMSVVGQVIAMAASSSVLLTTASIDDNLSRKISQFDDIISEIKSDRTVKYIKRDIKLAESLDYLKIREESMKEEQNKKYLERIKNLKINKNVNKNKMSRRK